MPRNMSMRKVIRVQKLQNKNRMVGKTFNPSGITAEQYDAREKNFVKEMQAKSQEELQAYYKNMKEMQKDGSTTNLVGKDSALHKKTGLHS